MSHFISPYSGTIVGERILTRADVEKYAELPAMDQLLGETVSALGYPAQRLRATLNNQPQTLAANLTQYVKDRSGVGGGGEQGDKS